MLITSLTNPKIKMYLKLKKKKNRDELKMFLIEGEHLVEEAIKSGLLIDLLVLQDKIVNYQIPYTYVSREIMQKLSNLESLPTVIGIVRTFENKEIKGNRVLILDDIQDPGNLGTIIRSSLAFNVTDIVLSLNSVDLYNEKVVRSTQGMLFKINIIRCDIKEVIQKLKTKDYQILGTSVQGGTDIKEVKVLKFALIMGNEGQGVKKEILDLCDKKIYIKMNRECESLNVGVATSILIYELDRC